MSVNTNYETSLLLQGKEGLYMLDDAFDCASCYLNIEDCNLHPDYLYVDVPNGKTVIGVDDILPIVHKSYLKPSIAEKFVVVVNHMECMTEAAQNKLLLSLENSPYLFMIGVSYEDCLLQTVKSRMKIVHYDSYTFNSFISYCENTFARADATLLFYICDGCPGMISTYQNDLPLFRDLEQACYLNNASKILEALHLVKEKDKLAVTGNKAYMRAVLRVMRYSYMEYAKKALEKDFLLAARYAEIVDKLTEDILLVTQSTYTKDTFFCTIMYCIEHSQK